MVSSPAYKPQHVLQIASLSPLFSHFPSELYPLKNSKSAANSLESLYHLQPIVLVNVHCLI